MTCEVGCQTGNRESRTVTIQLGIVLILAEAEACKRLTGITGLVRVAVEIRTGINVKPGLGGVQPRPRSIHDVLISVTGRESTWASMLSHRQTLDTVGVPKD